MNKQPPPRQFLDWYAEQFDGGAVNDSNYRECASYLEGLRDAMTPQLSEEAVQRLMRCESVLRAAGNMVQHARRHATAEYQKIQDFVISRGLYRGQRHDQSHADIVLALAAKAFAPPPEATHDLERRIEELEKYSHRPIDQTAIFMRLDALERAAATKSGDA